MSCARSARWRWLCDGVSARRSAFRSSQWRARSPLVPIAQYETGGALMVELAPSARQHRRRSSALASRGDTSGRGIRRCMAARASASVTAAASTCGTPARGGRASSRGVAGARAERAWACRKRYRDFPDVERVPDSRVERAAGRVLRSATPISERSASFTSSAVGKTRATSGSRMTRLEPATNRLKYFPRTPGPRSSRRYSVRSVSRPDDLGLLVDLALMSRRPSGADDSNAPVALDM